MVEIKFRIRKILQLNCCFRETKPELKIKIKILNKFNHEKDMFEHFKLHFTFYYLTYIFENNL